MINKHTNILTKAKMVFLNLHDPKFKLDICLYLIKIKRPYFLSTLMFKNFLILIFSFLSHVNLRASAQPNLHLLIRISVIKPIKNLHTINFLPLKCKDFKNYLLSSDELEF